MAKAYRAILIDPEFLTVDVRDVDGTSAMMSHLVGAQALDHFRLADHGDVLDYGWVSSDGLLRCEPVPAFKFRGWSHPLAGRCLILGAARRTGSTVSAKITVNFLKDNIDWLGLIVPEVTLARTEMGFRTIVT